MQIEADSLEQAFSKAAQNLNCSVTELDIKILQHPRAGFFGFFKKPAIIEVKKELNLNQVIKEENTKYQKLENDNVKKKKNKNRKKERNEHIQESTEQISNIVQTAFKNSDLEQKENKELNIQNNIEQKQTTQKHKAKDILDKSIIDTFNKDNDIKSNTILKDQIDEIEKKIKYLFDVSCFDINSIEVKLYNENTIQVILNGPDAALLIGKEGHRYRALSYILFNWLHSKYNYGLRLEIAEFLKTQEENIHQHINNIIQKVKEQGKAQSKPLDGALLRLALDKLRKEFPEKYVGTKNTNDGRCFIVINDFLKK